MKAPILRFPLRSRDLLALAGTLATLSAVGKVNAQSSNWTNPAGGLWSIPGNWLGGVVADGAGFTADFSTLDITSDLTVNVDSPRSISVLTFGDTNPATPATWTLANNNDPLNTLNLDGPAQVMVPGAATDLPVVISASLSGVSGFQKLGTGPLTLTGNNTISGSVTVGVSSAPGPPAVAAVPGGVLRLGPGGVLAATGLFPSTTPGSRFVVGGGTFTSSALSTINQGGGGFLLESGSASFNAGIRTATADGAVIRVDGGTFFANFLDLRRTQNFGTALPTTDAATNGLYITGGDSTIGTLTIGNSNSSTSARLDGGSLTVTGNVNVGATSNTRYCILQVKGGTFTSTDVTNGVVLGASTTTGNNTQFQVTGGVSTVEKISLGISPLVPSGSGNITMNGGTLYVGSGGIERRAPLAYNAAVQLYAGTLGAKNSWSSPINFTTGAVPTNNATIQAADASGNAFDITLNGIISGSSAFTKTGGGTLILNADNTYDGSGGTGTVISSGALRLGSGGTTGRLGTGPVTVNGSLIFQRSNELTVNNLIDGTGTVTQAGSGTLILNSGHTYSGGTIIAAGTLSLTNPADSATGSGPVTVQTGGTLGGTGSTAGTVSVQSGGILAPGTGVGTLTAAGLTLNAGSNLHIELDGTANDQAAVTGTLTLNGGAVRLRQAGTANTWSSPGKYYLIKYGTLAGTGISALSVANPVSGVNYTFGTETVGADNFVTLTLSAAATPNAWTANADGTWSTGANWSTGVPGGAGNLVNFLAAITAPRTITLDGPRTAGSLLFDNGNSYTLAGSDLTLNNNASPAAVTAQSGAHVINTNLILPAAGLNTTSQTDASLTFGGVVSGAAALRHQGPGTLRLQGANSFSGGTTLTGNAVVETTSASGLGSGAVTWTGNGVLRPAGSLTLANALTLSPGVNASVDVDGVDASVSGLVSGAGQLVKTGDGVLTLTNSNSWTGGLRLEEGLVAFTAPAQVGAGALTFAGGGIRWGTGNTDDLSARPLNLLAGGGLFDTGANNVTLTNAFGGDGAGGLTKAGSGNLTLQGFNTWTGGNVIREGTLVITTAENLGVAPVAASPAHLVLDGGTLQVDSSVILPASSGTALGAGGGRVRMAEGNALTLNGAISDLGEPDGVLNFEGAGTLNLPASSTFSGGGTMGLGFVNATASNALGTGVITLDGTSVTCGAVNLVNGWKVDSNATITLSNNATGTVLKGGLTGTGILTLNAAGVRGGVDGDWSGFEGDLILSGNGEFRILGFNEFLNKAKVNISGSTQLVLAVNPSVNIPRVIRIGQLTGTGSLGGQPVVGRTVRWTVGGLNTDSTFDGIIKDNMTQVIGVGNAASEFVKEGTGTLTLTGASTYTGLSIISNGTLMVNGDNTQATGPMTVEGGTLGGTGIMGGAVTVAAQGMLNPGTAIGTLTTGPLTVEGSLMTDYNNSAPGLIDRVAVNGNLTLAASSQLVLLQGGAFPVSGAQIIATYTGVLDGTFGTVTGLPVGYEVVYNYNDGVTSNNIAIVPGFSSPAYTAWLTANSLTGENAGTSSDPDKDGIINLLEFALDGNPNSAADSGKTRVGVSTIGADQVLTITFPVLDGAVFSGATSQTASVGGLNYTVEGSDDLSVWNTMLISEVTPAASAGLPALNTGWTYRTFRTPGAVVSDNHDYLRVKVQPGS